MNNETETQAPDPEVEPAVTSADPESETPLDAEAGLAPASALAGEPQEAIAPGASFACRFAPRDAGLFLWRPSAPAVMAEQNARGLHRLLLVEEQAPPAVDLDLPILLEDWRRALDAASDDPLAGAPKDAIAVNGAAAPIARDQRPGARVRLRLANACNARLRARGDMWAHRPSSTARRAAATAASTSAASPSATDAIRRPSTGQMLGRPVAG